MVSHLEHISSIVIINKVIEPVVVNFNNIFPDVMQVRCVFRNGKLRNQNQTIVL